MGHPLRAGQHLTRNLLESAGQVFLRGGFGAHPQRDVCQLHDLSNRPTSSSLNQSRSVLAKLQDEIFQHLSGKVYFIDS